MCMFSDESKRFCNQCGWIAGCERVKNGGVTKEREKGRHCGGFPLFLYSPEFH